MPWCQYHCQRQRHNTAEAHTSSDALEFRGVVLSSFMRSYAQTHPAARWRALYRLHFIRVHCFWFWFSRASTGLAIRLLRRNEVVMRPTCRWITFWYEVWDVRYELLTLRTWVGVHVSHHTDVRFYAYMRMFAMPKVRVPRVNVARKNRESKCSFFGDSGIFSWRKIRHFETVSLML